MTRRAFVLLAAAARTPIIVPVRHVLDRRRLVKPELLTRFNTRIWPEAVRDFGRSGIRFRVSAGEGEVRQSPAGKPVFTGLERGSINLLLIDSIPLAWDNGRGSSGLTMLHEGYNVCLIALANAHGHEIPLLSVNTCVHELLHVLMHDVFEPRPTGVKGVARESRIDWIATGLWLFGDSSAVRGSAEAWLRRVRASSLSGSSLRAASTPS